MDSSSGETSLLVDDILRRLVALNPKIVFRASSVARHLGRPPEEVRGALIHDVERGVLTARLEHRCEVCDAPTRQPLADGENEAYCSDCAAERPFDQTILYVPTDALRAHVSESPDPQSKKATRRWTPPLIL